MTFADDDPPQIDSALDPIRAAIQLVAAGSARRVTVYTPSATRLLPAARVLARDAGVAVEAADKNDARFELLVAPAPRRTA